MCLPFLGSLSLSPHLPLLMLPSLSSLFLRTGLSRQSLSLSLCLSLSLSVCVSLCLSLSVCLSLSLSLCVRACVRACVRVCVRSCQTVSLHNACAVCHWRRTEQVFSSTITATLTCAMLPIHRHPQQSLSLVFQCPGSRGMR